MEGTHQNARNSLAPEDIAQWVPSWLKHHPDSANDTKLDPLPDPLGLQQTVREQFKNNEHISVPLDLVPREVVLRFADGFEKTCRVADPSEYF